MLHLYVTVDLSRILLPLVALCGIREFVVLDDTIP